MRQTMRRTLGVTLSALALVAALDVGSATTAHATFAGTNGRLAFSRQGSIYTSNLDGTSQVRLTSSGYDYSPFWSPDGTKIAFVRQPSTGGAIWVMNADGTGAAQVSNVTRSCTQPPLWSPDGRWIAYWDFDESSGTTKGAIWRVSPDGLVRQRLTTYADANAVRGWSPDGRTLVFESDRDGDSDVWVMNADGTNPTKLTQNTVRDFGPTFSPDGTTIAFYRAPKGGRSTAIWVMNADGSGSRQLTAVSGFDLAPTWSPDGRWIAFRRDTMPRSGTQIRLFKVAPDGTGLTQLTGTTTWAEMFTWSPDSTTLLFTGEDGIVYRVGATGSGLARVFTNAGLPDWQAVR